MWRGLLGCVVVVVLAGADACPGGERPVDRPRPTTGAGLPAGVPLGLSFATYLGGRGNEQIRDVAGDDAGNLYLTGGTASPDFPTTSGAYQTAFNPGRSAAGARPHDAFVTKLAPDGTVVWSTLLGGPEYDRAYAIEVDAAGAVYVAGRAGAGFPVSDAAAQRDFGGGQEASFYGAQDGFVAKLSADGSRLLWATYFGTADPYIIRDIDVAADGAVILAAGYGAGRYPAAVQRAFANRPAGGKDTVVARLAPAGDRIEWARWLGGSGDDGVTPSVRVGPGGDVWIATPTRSDDAPTSDGAFDRSFGGRYDMYVARLDGGSGALRWATYLGGSGMDESETHALAVDPAGNAYVAGATDSPDFPVTAAAFQKRYGGSGGPDTGKRSNYYGDMYVARISADGSRLLAASYVGGRHGDGAEGIALDADGAVVLSGTSHSDDFPVTRGAAQTRFGGRADFAVVVLSDDLGRLLYGSYLGGSGTDYGRAVATAPGGALAIGGELDSRDWPVLAAGQPERAGGIDAAVARLARP